MKKLCNLIKQSLLDVIFPNTCLYCDTLTNRFLCEICLQLIELIEVDKFKSLKTAAVFENMGPMKCIDHYLQNGFHPKLAKLVSSYILIQLHRLNWMDLDYIARPKYTYFQKGSYPLIANYLSAALKLPLKHNFKDCQSKNILLLENFICKNLHENHVYRIFLCRKSVEVD